MVQDKKSSLLETKSLPPLDSPYGILYETAKWLLDREEYKQAQVYFLEALNLCGTTAPVSEEFISCSTGVAITYLLSKEYITSLNKFKEIFHALGTDLNAFHPGLISVLYFNLAIVYFSLQKPHQAKENFERGLILQISAYGEDNKELAKNYKKIASIAKDFNFLEISTEYNYQYYKILKKLAPENSEEKALAAWNIASINFKQNQTDQALLPAHEALDIYSFLHTENQDDYRKQMGRLCNMLGRIYFKSKKFIEAEHYFVLALNYTKTFYGQEHIGLVWIYQYLVITCVELKKLDPAIVFQKSAINVLRISNNSTELGIFYNGLGELYETLGKAEHASSAYKRALEFSQNDSKPLPTLTESKSIATVQQSHSKPEGFSSYLMSCLKFFNSCRKKESEKSETETEPMKLQ